MSRRVGTQFKRRPQTSSSAEYFQTVLHAIDDIKSQQSFQIPNPNFLQDSERPQTYPNNRFSRAINGGRYISHYDRYLDESDSNNTSSNKRFQDLNIRTSGGSNAIKSVPNLPIELGFLKGKKLPQSRGWRSTIKPPKDLLNDDTSRNQEEL